MREKRALEVNMNRIRALREDRDLRQIDVSIATGIDQKTLSNYETGKTRPDSYAIVELANFFGVTTDYLLGCSEKNYGDLTAVIQELENMQKSMDEIKKYLSSL